MTPTRQRLGHSDMLITRVGIGTAPIGSTPEWDIYWGPQDEQEAIRTIHAALDLGVNWIDTAPFYGWGRAEEIVGNALRGRRDQAFIFTKCGTLRDEQGRWYDDLKPESIRPEVEVSLPRLQTDYIDLYQFHDPDPGTPIEDSWATVQTLIKEGKVRYGGLSNHPVELIARAHALAPVTSNQANYSLLHRQIEEDVLPFAHHNGMGVLAWSPLESGYLTDNFDVQSLDATDFRRSRPFGQEPAAGKLQQLRASLTEIAHRHQKTLVDLAIAWVLRQPGLTGAIVGIRSEREARAMAGGVGWQLPDEELEAIEQALQEWES